MSNDDMPLGELIKLRRAKYELTKNIYCSFMKEVVYFNKDGFYHATHDGRGHIRGKLDSRMRLNLLPDINHVIENSHTFGDPPRVIPKNDIDNKTGKEIVFYKLEYKFNSRKTVAVILRRIGNGRLHYFSVMYVKQNRPR